MAAMEFTKKRRRTDGQFRAEELEVADILFSFCSFLAFPKWGAKNRRSAIVGGGDNCTHNPHNLKVATSRSSPVTPIGLCWSEAEELDGRAEPPPPARRLSSARPKSGRGRNIRSRKPPKKKTHSELKEMVNALSLEQDTLKEDVEQLLKTYQELQDFNGHLKSEDVEQLLETFQDLQDLNEHLKSELALRIGGSQEPQLTSITWPKLIDQELGHKTEMSAGFAELRRLDGHGCSKVIADSLALGLACDEPQSNGRSIYSHSPESSSGFEKEYLKPTKDVFCVGIPDLNAPSVVWSDAMRGGFRDTCFCL